MSHAFEQTKTYFRDQSLQKWSNRVWFAGHGHAGLQPRPHLAQSRGSGWPRAGPRLSRPGSRPSRAPAPPPASAPSPPPVSPRAPLPLSLPELLLSVRSGLLLLTRLHLPSPVIHRQDKAWWVTCSEIFLKRCGLELHYERSRRQNLKS